MAKFRNIEIILCSIITEGGMAVLGFMQLKTLHKLSNFYKVPLPRIDMKF